MFILAVPYRGRAIPFHFISYSSRTIAEEETSRNLEHHRALRWMKELIGKKPVVLDREFSYERLFEDFVEEGMKFVIRLNVGTRPTFTDREGDKVELSLLPGQKVFRRGLFYKGKVKVNVAGEWRKGFAEPLWVITNIKAEEGLRIYRKRMKVEESLKDLKSLLSLKKVMNKRREYMEKVVALVLLAYAIGLLVGEALRDKMYGVSRSEGASANSQGQRKGKWKLYSGLFVLLKQKIRLGREELNRLIAKVLEIFRRLIYKGVLSNV